MSESHTSEWPDWNTLTPTFKSSFPAFKEEVYHAAGEIWPAAVNFARGHHLDESDAREVLLNAVASVSNTENDDIHSLPRYVFKTYARLFQRALMEQEHHASIEAVNSDLAAGANPADLMDRAVLLGEIVARMDAQMVEIYEGLILGYSFEELAHRRGEKSNVLRSRFSKGIHRIAREIRARE